MIRINLLPVRQIKKSQKLFRQALAFVASLLLLFAGMGLTAISQANHAERLKNEISSLNKKKASYQAIEIKIKKLKADRAALEQKLTAIKQLKKGAQQPVRILDAIATLTPADRLWLKSMQQSPDKLQLSGVALDNATIAQYMQNLVASPFFSSATLGGASLIQIGGRKLKSFTLTLAIQAPEPVAPEPPTTGKKK